MTTSPLTSTRPGAAASSRSTRTPVTWRPLALESGTGSELRFPLGVTIIGGLLLSQLLTLYTTPVIYLGMERLRLRLTRPTPPSPAPQAAE